MLVRIFRNYRFPAIFLAIQILIIHHCNFMLKGSYHKTEEHGDDNISVVIHNTEFHTFYDKHRLFKTMPFLFPGDDWNTLSKQRKLCLAAQASIDKSYWLLEMVKTWSGPISIAIFTPDIEFHITWIYLQYLRRCFPKVRKQISFHISFPYKHTIQKSDELNNIIIENLSCYESKDVLDRLLKVRSESMMRWREKMKYPQNHLRNVAKQGCQTNFTFVPDIDMIPIPNLDLELEQFLGTVEVQSCSNCAYVVPTYEIHENVTDMPKDKDELVELFHDGLARSFHIAFFSPNQMSSQLPKWIRMPKQERLGVAYEIEKFRMFYEPMYVSRSNTPLFDERFIGFGMTRNTQV